MTLSHRHKRYTAALTLTVALAIGIGALGGLVLMHGHQWFSVQVSIILVALVGAAGIVACLPWWRALDELQRGAHLTSWYWGGSFGAVFGVMTAGVVGGIHSSMVSGALLVAGAEVVSFAVFWAAFRLIHRSAES